jgi:carbon-monoxide dehydrogenase small subunit
VTDTDKETHKISVTVNGSLIKASVEPRTHLADFLRDDLLLTGTHLGCEQGVCGACTILVDGRPVRSCLTFARGCDGADIRTIEGLNNDPLMKQIQEAFSENHGLQCGYCTPGMLATAYDIVRRLPDIDDQQVRKELSGNLCRCTGYAGIVASIRQVLDSNPENASVRPITRQNKRPNKFLETEKQSPPVNIEPSAVPVSFDISPEEIEGVSLEREIKLDLSSKKLWEIISDLPTVASCIPGMSLQNVGDDGTVTGRLTVAVGPIRASFSGKGYVNFDSSTKSGELYGAGIDRLTRSKILAKLFFRIKQRDEKYSNLSLNVTYDLRGPLSQFGRKALVEEIADNLLRDITKSILAKASGIQHEGPEIESFKALPFIGAVLKSLIMRLLRFDKS